MSLRGALFTFLLRGLCATKQHLHLVPVQVSQTWPLLTAYTQDSFPLRNYELLLTN